MAPPPHDRRRPHARGRVPGAHRREVRVRGARGLARGAARRHARRALPRRARRRRRRDRARVQRARGRLRRAERVRRGVRRARSGAARRLRRGRPARPGRRSTSSSASATSASPAASSRPIYQDIDPLSPEFLAVCAALERLELPMLIHQGTTFSRAGSLLQANPALLDVIALRHPRLTMVIAHMGHPWFDEAIQVVRRHPNVYADVSALVSRRWLLYNALVAAAEYGVTHKLLFGTDFPFFTARQTIDGLRSLAGTPFGPDLPRDRRGGRGGHHPPSVARTAGAEMTQAEKGAAFAALHEGEPFLIPNPWDAGSARVLEALGFKALATTSSGFAFTLGRLDGGDDARRGRRAHGCARRRDRAAGRGRPRERLRRVARGGRERDHASRRGGRGRRLDRGLGSGRPPLRARARGRADRGRGRDGARRSASRSCSPPRREPHPRQPRPRRHDRAAAGVRGGRADVLYAPGLRTVERSARCATP